MSEPIYNDASLLALDSLLEEYNSAETTDERREEIEPLLLGLSEQKEAREIELREAYINCEADAASVEPLMKRLTARKNMAEKKMETAKRIIAALVGEGNKKKLADGGEIGWRKSSRTITTDELPNSWRKPGAPMLTEIGKALKAGEHIPGAYIEEHNNIQIK